MIEHTERNLIDTNLNELQIRNLKYLAPLSTIGNCVTLASFGVICYYIFRPDDNPMSFEGKKAVGSLSDFSLFFGTVLFAMEAIGVVSINNQLVWLSSQISQCSIAIVVSIKKNSNSR